MSAAAPSVVVIGGGVAGMSAAWALARAGCPTTVVEMEHQLGHHATGRSAAILSETSGHPAVCDLAALSRPFFESPPEGFSDYPLVSPRGLLWVGDAASSAALDQLADRPRSRAAGARRIDAAECRELVRALRPSAVAAGGVYEPEARTVDVAELLSGFARGARAAGAEVVVADEALALERRGSRWEVTCRHGERTAEVVIDAAGAWGDEVARRAGLAPIGLQPRRRTACLVPLEREMSDWPMVMDIAGQYYFEPEAGGVLLSPADEHPSEPMDARHDELDVALALDRLATVTDLAPRSVRRAWAGLRTFSPDGAPVIGADPDMGSFVWCVGQAGAGIKTAPAMADLVVSAVLGGGWPPDLDRRLLGPERFRSHDRRDS